MTTDRYSWHLVEPGKPLERSDDAGRDPESGEVVIRVAGCGVCHTDLGYADGHVATRAPLPLVLGHEIVGTVIDAAADAASWIGRDVLVPAVIPCGECANCASGRGNICANQKMPGNDLDGGFATHVTLPTSGLAVIETLPDGYELADFAVIADAVTTPLQAVRRANVGAGDLAVVVGAGGVGSYAVQVAAASGATVVAIDVDDARLDALADHGASATVNAREGTVRDTRNAVRQHAKTLGASATAWKIFECSGTAAGQETAFAMLGPAATLAVIGFTMDKVSVRLSNLMAFDADAFGSWGCPPERYPEAINLVASGQVDLLPFTRKVPMEQAEAALATARDHSDPRRSILVP